MNKKKLTRELQNLKKFENLEKLDIKLEQYTTPADVASEVLWQAYMQEDIEALKEITPLTNDELKAWLPDEINGMKRTSFKAGQTSFMKIASIEASYSNEDKSKTFKIQVIDGAGEMGAAATAGMRMLFSQDFEEETETQVKRSIKKKGVKAIEEYRKDGSNCTIQFMQDDRFYINASGRNMDLDETWKAIDDLDVQNLG